MKKPFPKMILRILLVCVLLLGFLYMDDDIGTSAANLESDIRNLQKIPEDWIAEGDVSDTMAAYISYPQDRSDHTFSVYVNRPGLSFGYFFRGGGSLSGVERGIAEFTVSFELWLYGLTFCVQQRDSCQWLSYTIRADS